MTINEAIESAFDELKIGGDVEKAKVYAILALVEAVRQCGSHPQKPVWVKSL